MATILEVRRLVKRYQMGERTIEVLNGIDLSVHAGELLMIVGRSGAGKSTLLHLMGLLDTPTAGDVLVDGEDVARKSPRQQARIRNREFGYVFQFYHLLPELTALENVFLPRMIQHGAFEWFLDKERHRARAEELLVKVGLAERLTHRPSQLSGGERQRVAIARALMNRPRLVLCDEPTGNLDEHTSEQILDLLCELNERDGQGFVIVTHDQDMARRRGHRIVEITDGRIVGESAGEAPPRKAPPAAQTAVATRKENFAIGRFWGSSFVGAQIVLSILASLMPASFDILARGYPLVFSLLLIPLGLGYGAWLFGKWMTCDGSISLDENAISFDIPQHRGAIRWSEVQSIGLGRGPWHLRRPWNVEPLDRKAILVRTSSSTIRIELRDVHEPGRFLRTLRESVEQAARGDLAAAFASVAADRP